MSLSDYQYATSDEIKAYALHAMRPPPRMPVWQWADRYRMLSVESSARPGRFKTSIVEYLREPMEMVGKAGVNRITLMTSAQVGKSTFVENVIGYYIHLDPSPILHVSPTLDSMKMFSRERLAPMIRDTSVLRKLVRDPRSRSSGNTLATKTFPGGLIAMVGSNAPSGLASRPIRIVLFDEVDRFEPSAGTEGDPITVAVKRTTTYWNRILVFVSTPGDKGASRIEREFREGDQRYRWCPCPHCGEYQRLYWRQVRFTDNDPNTAFYECEHNGCVIGDEDRISMVNLGEWRAEKPFNGSVSYHLSQLYSPFAMLSDGVRDFLRAKDNPQLLKVWVNTFLGETWEERGARLEWQYLLDNREEYETRENIPEDVTVITVAVDVQDDRFELEYVGWGDDYQSWSLGYHVIYGDLSTPKPWQDLKENLDMTFMHPIFGEMTWRSCAIDSGGHFTQAVYKFAQSSPRTVAIKGVDGVGKPIFGRPMKNTIGNARVIPLGVDTIKELVTARLKQKDPVGAGYCRFPMPDQSSPEGWYDDRYFMGLCAEELRTTFIRGFPVMKWQKLPGRRNEPFDIRVYNTAALEMLQIDLNAHRRSKLREIEERSNPGDEVKKPKPHRHARRSKDTSWVHGWKK